MQIVVSKYLKLCISTPLLQTTHIVVKMPQKQAAFKKAPKIYRPKGVIGFVKGKPKKGKRAAFEPIPEVSDVTSLSPEQVRQLRRNLGRIRQIMQKCTEMHTASAALHDYLMKRPPGIGLEITPSKVIKLWRLTLYAQLKKKNMATPFALLYHTVCVLIQRLPEPDAASSVASSTASTDDAACQKELENMTDEELKDMFTAH